jgi:Family of unknown function (DUF6328)
MPDLELEPSTRQDDEGDRYERDESQSERLDRNWAELLQELRVVQTGVQLLTGFLLTLPFQQRFPMLSHTQHTLYLVVVMLSALATALLIAPVALHRLLFRQHARREQVSLAHWMALAGSAMLGLALCGVVTLIFDVVIGLAAGIVLGAVTLTIVGLLWAALPLRQRAIHRRREHMS